MCGKHPVQFQVNGGSITDRCYICIAVTESSVCQYLDAYQYSEPSLALYVDI